MDPTKFWVQNYLDQTKKNLSKTFLSLIKFEKQAGAKVCQAQLRLSQLELKRTKNLGWVGLLVFGDLDRLD